MTLSPRIARAAVLALALGALAACASKPKPAPEPAYTPPPAARPEPPRPRPQPPITATSNAPIPGSEQDFVINAGDRVFFDYDQYSIRADAAPMLDAQAAWLNRYRSVKVRIEGNCDERGTREYNFALGARRANAVRDYLVSRGVDAARIDTISYGKERPMDPGENEAAWARNRNGHTQITSGSR